jgi:hypothetical protein
MPAENSAATPSAESFAESKDNVVRLRADTKAHQPYSSIPPAAPAGSALDLLNRRKQQPASTPMEEGNDGGESMNLDMKVVALPDGELQLGSVDGHEDLDDEKYGHEWHKATRSMAREEENILHHRHPDDPGYDDHDFDHYDGEHER